MSDSDKLLNDALSGAVREIGNAASPNDLEQRGVRRGGSDIRCGASGEPIAALRAARSGGDNPREPGSQGMMS